MDYEFLMQNIGWIAIAGVSGGRMCWLLFKGGDSNEVTPTEATLLMNREHAILVDVRDTAERASGFIPKARHIALDNLEQKAADLDKYKSRPIVVYCASGKRSARACNVLRKKGFTQVYGLAGGMDAWREAGLPISTK